MRFLAGASVLLLLACLVSGGFVSGQSLKPAPADHSPPAQVKEKLTYSVEWRLARAGTVTIERQPQQTSMRMESAGLLSTLFKVQDVYTVNYEDAMCATSSVMETMERDRHHEARVTYDRASNHAAFVERDLIKNMVVKETGTDIPNCVADALGALAKLRAMNLGVGQSAQVAVSDGRRSGMVKVMAQEREGIRTATGMHQTIRYSADLMNGVVYTRKGELLLWMTDDARRLPVRLRLRTTFPISTVTLELEKEEHP
jgi:hypothetical protein